MSFLKKIYDKKIDGTGLAVFRIAYSIVLLCEISSIFYFRHLIFDKIPYLDEAEINFAIPIGIWFFSVVFILLGFFTKFFTILNYIMSLILIGSINTFEYHVFYAYMGINFLIIFMPIAQCLSIDRLLVKLKYSNTTFQYYPPKTVSQLFYFILPFVAIGLVYFDSVFFKLHSSMWLAGLGSWLPSSLPMMTHVNTSWLLNNEYLVKSIGWITIIFEAFFLFIFWRKKWRLIVFTIGQILHLGILLQFPIPWFALTLSALYLLLIPVSFWNRLLSRKSNKPTLTFFYDAECPLCIRTKIIISHFDWFSKIEFKSVQFHAKENAKLKNIDESKLLNDIYSVSLKGNVYCGVDTYIQVTQRIFYLAPLSLVIRIPGIYHVCKSIYAFIAKNRTVERCTESNCGYSVPNIFNDNEFKILNNFTLYDLKYKGIKYILIFCSVSQFLFLYRTWLINDVRVKLGVKNTYVDKFLSNTIGEYSNFTRVCFGLTNHPVFSNEIHFNRYNHIIAIAYIDENDKEVWLPIIDKNGQPSYYNYGCNWVNWTFRSNGLDIDSNKLNAGIMRYTAFWLKKHDKKFNNATFLVKVKLIHDPKNWEYNFLNKQIAKPWLDGGYIEWKNNSFYSNIKDIESIK